jgi:hypothetical protein
MALMHNSLVSASQKCWDYRHELILSCVKDTLEDFLKNTVIENIYTTYHLRTWVDNSIISQQHFDSVRGCSA